jgi:hypothetical protein
VTTAPGGPWQLFKRSANAASDDLGNALVGDLRGEQVNLIPSDEQSELGGYIGDFFGILRSWTISKDNSKNSYLSLTISFPY